MLRQGHDGLPESEELEDHFGITLAVGDFDNDHHDDLAIGVRNEELNPPAVPATQINAGVVHVVYGNDMEPPIFGSELLYESSTTFDLCGDSAAADYFGISLATGDFNDGTFDDLAIGSKKTIEGINEYHGDIHVVFGSASGLRDTDDQCIDENDMELVFNESDNFGYPMTSCDYNGDGHSDLAIGAPMDHDHAEANGSLVVVYGGSDGIIPSTAELFQQGHDGLQEEAEEGDRFGDVMTGGNFNGDSYCDLAVGVPVKMWMSQLLMTQAWCKSCSALSSASLQRATSCGTKVHLASRAFRILMITLDSPWLRYRFITN